MTWPILGVTARWREDQPDGFAVTVSFETPDMGEHFARQLTVAIQGLDRDERWSPQIAFRHLRDVGRMSEARRSETIRRRAVGIVAWLQERGHLIADAHNGVAWQRRNHVPEVPAALALSEAPAVPEVPEAPAVPEVLEAPAVPEVPVASSEPTPALQTPVPSEPTLEAAKKATRPRARPAAAKKKSSSKKPRKKKE